MTVVIIWYMGQGIILFIFSRNEITDALLPQVSDGGFGRRIVHGYDGHRVWIVGGNGNHETGVSISVERAVCQIQGSVIIPQSQMFTHWDMVEGFMGLHSRLVFSRSAAGNLEKRRYTLKRKITE